MTISHDETNWETVAFCPFSSSPWPPKQQTMIKINLLLVLHLQLLKLPGHICLGSYGPTKTTNLSNFSAPITSSTKCHKTADTIQHDPPSVPQGTVFFRLQVQPAMERWHVWKFWILQVHDLWLLLATYWWCPKVLHQNNMKNHLYMYACQESKDIHICIYIHTVCMIYPIKLSHFYRISPTRNTQWSHIPGLPSQAGHFWVDDFSFFNPFSMVNNMLVSWRVYV